MAKSETVNNHHIHISSKNRLFSLNLKEVWGYRDLITLFTKRSFALTYKQTILGPIWIILNPLMTCLIYSFVFGGIAGIGTDGVPQILFYLIGNAAWSFFSTSLTKNARTFIDNANVFGKVYFPRLTIPVSTVLAATIQFFIQFVMSMCFLGYYFLRGEVHPHWALFWVVPVVLIHLGMLGLGCGIIVSSLTTKYRDLGILINFGVQLWMYGTPVVYPLTQISSDSLKTIVCLNPVTAPVELLRYSVLGNGTVMPEYLLLSWIMTLVILILGIVIFNRVEKTFMDTV